MDISRNAHPLPSLALPCIIPKLEGVVAITRLFPELRKLTMMVEGSVSFGCGRPWMPRLVTSVDRRLLDLRDDDASDNPPGDEIFDTESEERPNFISMEEYTKPEIFGSNGVHNILRWIFAGQLILPPNIEVFRLELRLELAGDSEELSSAQQQQATSDLALAYPALWQVQFGLPHNTWERTGGLWKGQVESVTHREEKRILEKLAAMGSFPKVPVLASAMRSYTYIIDVHAVAHATPDPRIFKIFDPHVRSRIFLPAGLGPPLPAPRTGQTAQTSEEIVQRAQRPSAAAPLRITFDFWKTDTERWRLVTGKVYPSCTGRQQNSKNLDLGSVLAPKQGTPAPTLRNSGEQNQPV
ncbi:hypothetical protein DFH09DRAFT_1396064 [Mycena vulgaris]|nr:hypothetical protein DFH09DRAFT_1396064 [Mycena vulgaris]